MILLVLYMLIKYFRNWSIYIRTSWQSLKNCCSLLEFSSFFLLSTSSLFKFKYLNIRHNDQHTSTTQVHMYVYTLITTFAYMYTTHAKEESSLIDINYSIQQNPKDIYVAIHGLYVATYSVCICIKTFSIKCDQLCQNPPLIHTMAKKSFYRQWIAPSIN